MRGIPTCANRKYGMQINAKARLQSAKSAYAHLSNADIKSLKKGREKLFATTDIEAILREMPVIPKGKYIGDMSAHRCHQNALDVRNKTGAQAYKGYIINPPMVMTDHSFNVVDGKVEDHTPGYAKGFSTDRYIGVPVPAVYTKHTATLDKRSDEIDWVRKQIAKMGST